MLEVLAFLYFYVHAWGKCKSLYSNIKLYFNLAFAHLLIYLKEPRAAFVYLFTPSSDPPPPFSVSHDLICFPFITGNIYPGFLTGHLATLLPVISYILSLPLSVTWMWWGCLGDCIILCVCFYILVRTNSCHKDRNLLQFWHRSPQVTLTLPKVSMYFT